MIDTPLVTIIVPTYNEAEDIVPTLAAAAAVDYPAKEIVVVDDASTDATMELVEAFAHHTHTPIRLLRQPRNRGVAAARNVGLREARGEIAILLNADVRLPSDFIRRVLPHYEAGCDYLVVNSRVSNTDYLYPRYVHLMHLMQYSDPENSEWSEGYSCRREAALAVGGFPEEFPGASGEDAVFGQRMRARFRKGYDPTIDAPHVVPATWRGFWSQRRGRGRGSAYLLHRFRKWSLSPVRLLRMWLGLIALIAVLYPVWGDGLRLARLSPRGWRDWLPMGWARAVDMIAQQVGYTRGWMEIRAASR